MTNDRHRKSLTNWIKRDGKTVTRRKQSAAIHCRKSGAMFWDSRPRNYVYTLSILFCRLLIVHCNRILISHFNCTVPARSLSTFILHLYFILRLIFCYVSILGYFSTVCNDGHVCFVYTHNVLKHFKRYYSRRFMYPYILHIKLPKHYIL